MYLKDTPNSAYESIKTEFQINLREVLLQKKTWKNIYNKILLKVMRLANGIIIDKEKTFGVLKFSALRREVHIQNEDGTVSEEIKERTYDLKCKEKGRMIQVSIPATVPLKEFDYNAEVEIINPIADTVATATFQGADVDWYIKADDIVLKNKNGQPAGNNHAPNNSQHKK